MGHHIDGEGRFQSDRHPDLEPDKIVLSFRDPHAQLPLLLYALRCAEDDPELSEDLQSRLRSIESGG